MVTLYEYCNKCQGTRTVSISIALKPIEDSNGEMTEMVMLNYHCETCNSFLRQVPFSFAEGAEKTRMGEIVASIPQS